MVGRDKRVWNSELLLWGLKGILLKFRNAGDPLAGDLRNNFYSFGTVTGNGGATGLSLRFLYSFLYPRYTFGHDQRAVATQALLIEFFQFSFFQRKPKIFPAQAVHIYPLLFRAPIHMCTFTEFTVNGLVSSQGFHFNLIISRFHVILLKGVTPSKTSHCDEVGFPNLTQPG
jgi:hypothetical protein